MHVFKINNYNKISSCNYVTLSNFSGRGLHYCSYKISITKIININWLWRYLEGLYENVYVSMGPWKKYILSMGKCISITCTFWKQQNMTIVTPIMSLLHCTLCKSLAIQWIFQYMCMYVEIHEFLSVQLCFQI